MKLSQFNVKIVFLYEELTKEIYIAQPEDFSDEPTKFVNSIRVYMG